MNRTPINKSFHTDTNSRPAKLLQKVFLSENISQKHKGGKELVRNEILHPHIYLAIILSLYLYFLLFISLLIFWRKKKGGGVDIGNAVLQKNMMYHKTLWLLTKILFSIINFFILFHLNVTKNVIKI